MNTQFLMEILGNPQNFTKDQRKIAVKMALKLLDTMEFEDPMKKPIETTIVTGGDGEDW